MDDRDSSAPLAAASDPAVVSHDAAQTSDASWIGRVLDERYRIERLLGEGGMGAVFLAEQLKLQKKVALKVILPQLAGNDELAARFAREAMASAKLDHPNVVSALDYGTLPDGGAYLVMQLAKGRPLRDVMEERPADLRLALEVGAQIADALAAAHAARIVHRDLKPDNVILDVKDDGGMLARVLDFGIARLVDDAPSAGPALTRVGAIMGTPGYMAPEQALGESVDERADLYALGVILWEMVTGEQLFPEEAFAAIVARQLTHTTPLPSSKRFGVPSELDALVESLLAPKERRGPRAAEVRRVLLELSLRDELKRRDSTGSQIGTAQTMLGTAASITGPSITGPSITGPSITGPSITGPSVTGPSISHARPSLLDAGALGDVAKKLAERPRAIAVAIGIALLSLTGVLTVAVVTCSACTGQPDVVATSAPPGTTPTILVPPPFIPTPPTPPPSARALGADFDVVATSDDADEREAAAQRILADATSPPLAVMAAQLELAESCRARRDQLRGIIALSDPRSLPLLERLDALPRRGCGFIRSQDCHRCLRADLRDALQTMRAPAR